MKGPEDGRWFGANVDANNQFMVVSGFYPNFLHVYQSYSPYNMVAKFPLDGVVYSLVISDDNTVAVSHDVNHHHTSLTIYQYDGSFTWNIAQKFKLEHAGDSLAMYGDVLVVGAPFATYYQNRIRIRIRRFYSARLIPPPTIYT